MTGLLLATLQELPSAPPPEAAGGYGLFLFETLCILVAVCGLAWLVLRFRVRRLSGGGATAASGPLRVLARLPLEPRRTVYLVEAAGKALLIGAAETGPLSVLAELDEHAVAAAVAATPRPRRFLEVLTRPTARSADRS